MPHWSPSKFGASYSRGVLDGLKPALVFTLYSCNWFWYWATETDWNGQLSNCMLNGKKFVSRIYFPRFFESETATEDSVPTEDGGRMFNETSINLC